VRRYASATVVGMSLTDDAPSELGQIEALLSGVANPGGVVEELPPAMLRSLAIDPVPALDETKSRRIAVRSLPATAARDPAEATADATDDQALIKMDAVTRSNLQQALALPGVKVELDKLSGILNARPLLDEAFRRGVFEEEMKKNYRIVHIASHGVFSGDPKDSFIITYDHTLDMNRLEELFKSESFSDQPVEILTLSACQTAEGDDRSPLGLSGVAIKSGARSALGSLWPVSDDAAQILLPGFYTNLSEQGLGKARSLQQAQIALLQQPEFEHPTFWASFVLVGNWL
jgi:CHAT domain-containing protein